MARTWLSIRVELVEGRGTDLWPRPGRIFAAARRHTFADLAGAIDDAFARWDRAHLHQFWLAGGTRVTSPDPEWDEDNPLDEARLTLSRLQPGEQFAYEFDFGDGWLHLCTVAEQRIDPLETLGITPIRPMPYWGWARYPTSTGANGTATTAKPALHVTPRAPTSHESVPGNIDVEFCPDS